MLGSLVQLVRRSRDRELYEQAASCLNSLCAGAGREVDKARQYAVDAGLLPVLTCLLAAADLEAAADPEAVGGAGAAEAAAAESASVVGLGLGGGVALDGLKAGVLLPDAVSTLGHLASLAVCQRAVADAGAVAPLGRLLQQQTDLGWLGRHSTHPARLHATLAALLKLCDHPPNRAAMTAVGVVPLAVKVIRGREVYGHQNQTAADQLLRNLMAGGEAPQQQQQQQHSGWYPSSADVAEAGWRGPKPVGSMLSPDKEHGSKWRGAHRGSMLGAALRDDLQAEEEQLLEAELEILALEDRQPLEGGDQPGGGGDALLLEDKKGSPAGAKRARRGPPRRWHCSYR